MNINLKPSIKMGKAVLYISYDGMLEPLGQSQVISYLKALASNRPIFLISFEKSADWLNVLDRQRIASEIARAGIVWYPLRYHKHPTALATAWDIACGILLGLWLVLRHRIGIVHARSYVPSVMALTIKRLAGVKYIFDMRGFWADERLDGGLWSPRSRMYLLAKGFERRFLLSADHVVSLTHAAVFEMQRFDYLQDRLLDLTVIPTCANLTHFKPMPRMQVDEGLVLGYVGTVGTWYLFDEVARCFALLLTLRPDAKFLIVNRNEHSYIRERLDLAGVPYSAVELITATHSEMPKQMSRMDAGVFFIKPVFSKQASAPTKLAEFLGCGIPCLTNAGVGDIAELLEKDHVGLAITSFDDEAMIAALNQLVNLIDDPESLARCVASAQEHFSLDEGVSRYQNIYRELS